MSDLVARKAVVDATIARFDRQPLVWSRFDCGRLAAFVLRARGFKVRLSAFGQFTTAAGAKAALGRMGFDDMPQAIDSYGPARITPSQALPADLIGFPPQPDPENPLPGDDMTAIAVYVGNGRVLGFHAGTGLCRIVQPDLLGGDRPPIAWRV